MTDRRTVVRKVSMKALIIPLLLFAACTSSQSSPAQKEQPAIDQVDSTIGGAVLGAAWGAGAGAVIGNQVSYLGEGAAVGAGFGAVSGAVIGAGHDSIQNQLFEQEQELEQLQLRNALNSRNIGEIQSRLDTPPANLRGPSMYQVQFDPDVTSIRVGAVSALDAIAEAIKTNPYVKTVRIEGHSDDNGSPEYNERVAESRARSVMAFFATKGVALDRMQIKSFGSTRPLASNTSPEGRQLNRRVEIIIENRG